MCIKTLQLRPTLCNPMDCSPLIGAPLSMGFSRQEYWSVFPSPSPEDLPNPGIKLPSLVSPALAGRFFTTSTTWEALAICKHITIRTDPGIVQYDHIESEGH